MITITSEIDTECGECGYGIPADAGFRSDYHDSECSRYVVTMLYSEAEESYRDYLDDVFEPVQVCGHTYDAGRALQSLDPGAFRQGVLDWADQGKIEFVNHL